MIEPTTPEQWQEAVDMAEAWLRIDSARAYGLVTGGPKVNVVRCRALIAQGLTRGFRPSQEKIDAILLGMAQGG